MPESDGILEYMFGQQHPTELFTYTPEPARCRCGAALSYTSSLSDARVPDLTLTITHPDPVCNQFQPMLRGVYFPAE